MVYVMNILSFIILKMILLFITDFYKLIINQYFIIIDNI